MKKVALSAAQASGNLHLGNYLGSMVHWLKMQDQYQCFFFIADLHALTVHRPAAELKLSIFRTTAMYLAAGLLPEKVTIFTQSSVKEHAELAWILSCVTPVAWLRRMTQFKDKTKLNLDQACLGLLSYPVLMAADILLYQTDIVPVGEDQKQHLELTRDIAAVINRKFNCQVFKLPEPFINDSATRIMSIRDGLKKMSKSSLSDAERINLSDSADQISQKIIKAKTDNIAEISYDRKLRPEISNLIDIYSALAGRPAADIVAKYSNNNSYAAFKSDLTEIIISSLAPITRQYHHLVGNQDYLQSVLAAGSARAGVVASQTVQGLKERLGLMF